MGDRFGSFIDSHQIRSSFKCMNPSRSFIDSHQIRSPFKYMNPVYVGTILSTTIHIQKRVSKIMNKNSELSRLEDDNASAHFNSYCSSISINCGGLYGFSIICINCGGLFGGLFGSSVTCQSLFLIAEKNILLLALIV